MMDELSPAREEALRAAGFQQIAGVDEVGRGPLAGPVMAAAVILDPARMPHGLQDSKRLSARRRDVLAAEIADCAAVGVGTASVAEIDQINILQATFLAMHRAIAALPVSPDYLLIDGNRLPRDLPAPAEALVGGDGRSPSIAAASIVAKVARDRVMMDLAQHHPGYGWETNMGYPSKSHRTALQNLGVTPHHRQSFAPVRDILWQAKSASD